MHDEPRTGPSAIAPAIATVAAIDRYPVKGLSAEPLGQVALAAGRALAHDRRFALARSPRADPEDPVWRPKGYFLQLVAMARLAALRTRFDAETLTLRISVGPGGPARRFALADAAGRAALEAWLADHLGAGLRHPPRLLEASGHHGFADTPAPHVSIINRASVQALARSLGRPVDPRRFRGNLLIDGPAPWAEFGWTGRTLTVGEARLQVVEPIERCVATNIDPAGAGKPDMAIPEALDRGFGHRQCGVYAIVTAGGTVAVGDRVALDPAA